MESPSNGSKYHVPNLERALRIMELFSKHPEGLTTAEITEHLNIPRNSVFRITATLLDHGYLIRDEQSKAFQLSRKLLTVGYSAISEHSLIDKALPVMRRLRDRFKETVPLGILNGKEGMVIEQVQGSHSFRFVLDPGRHFHLHTSAPGKALVAFLPEDVRKPLVNEMEFLRFNKRTITNKTAYRKELERVKERGYAVDFSEETEGMHCIGAPIFNHHGYPIAAIWVTGPSMRLQEGDFNKIGPEVKRAADQISQKLGFGLLDSKPLKTVKEK